MLTPNIVMNVFVINKLECLKECCVLILLGWYMEVWIVHNITFHISSHKSRGYYFFISWLFKGHSQRDYHSSDVCSLFRNFASYTYFRTFLIFGTLDDYLRFSTVIERLREWLLDCCDVFLASSRRAALTDSSTGAPADT